MLCGLWTAETQPAWSPQVRFVNFGFGSIHLMRPGGMFSMNASASATLEGIINKWCWEPERLERFLCQGACLGTVLVPPMQTELRSSDKTRAASSCVYNAPIPLLLLGILFILFIIFLLRVRNLRIIKPAENIMQAGKWRLISGTRPDPRWHITLCAGIYAVFIGWRKDSCAIGM